MRVTPSSHRAVITTQGKRKSSCRLSSMDIGPAVELFIRLYPQAPQPDVAHSKIQYNVILLKNKSGVIAVATTDGNFLASLGGPEFDGGNF